MLIFPSKRVRSLVMILSAGMVILPAQNMVRRLKGVPRVRGALAAFDLLQLKLFWSLSK